MAPTNCFAIFLICFHPYQRRLPLPSSKMIRSRKPVHFRVLRPRGSSSAQSKSLQVWKSSRVSSSSSPGHSPRPRSGSITLFLRWALPPWQAFEHKLHASQSAKTQSALHD